VRAYRQRPGTAWADGERSTTAETAALLGVFACYENGWNSVLRTLLTKRAMPEFTPALVAKFEARVERVPFDTCWFWTGVHSQRGGYAVIDWQGEQYRAHRMAYELYRGPLPLDTRSIDHLCRVHECVNPTHLEVVAQKTNVLRGVGPTAENARKAVCLRGHPFTPENTYRFVGTDGYRRRGCRSCQRTYYRRRLQKEESGE
jgi:hypothetical protein